MADSGINDGDIGYVEQLNNVYPEISIYTSTGFNATRSTTGTTSNNTTLSISAGLIKRYVKIYLTVSCEATSRGGASVDVTASAGLKIETAENSGSFTTRFDNVLLYASDTNHEGKHNTTQTILFTYEPTSGEMTNGLDIKITGTAIVDESTASGVASITNRQTTIEYI